MLRVPTVLYCGDQRDASSRRTISGLGQVTDPQEPHRDARGEVPGAAGGRPPIEVGRAAGRAGEASATGWGIVCRPFAVVRGSQTGRSIPSVTVPNTRQVAIADARRP
jgi:hypothetical protein